MERGRQALPRLQVRGDGFGDVKQFIQLDHHFKDCFLNRVYPQRSFRTPLYNYHVGFAASDSLANLRETLTPMILRSSRVKGDTELYPNSECMLSLYGHARRSDKNSRRLGYCPLGCEPSSPSETGSEDKSRGHGSPSHDLRASWSLQTFKQ